MPEVKREVKTIQVDMKCERCPSGFMRPTGVLLTSMPPKYEHLCGDVTCMNKANFSRSYPYVTYEVVEPATTTA